ncbi:anti-sigma factor family protein [Candidatus Latescibacterota bacterium]
MDCDKVKDLFPFFNDESLSRDESDAIGAHLEQCESCRSEYQALGNLLVTFRESGAHRERECPPEFLDAVRAKIDRKKETRFVYRMALSAAAVVMFVLGISLYMYFPGGSSSVNINDFVIDDGSTEFESYVASNYLNAYELNSLVGDSDDSDESDDSEEDSELLHSFFASNFIDISPEDFIETMNDEDIELVLASY